MRKITEDYFYNYLRIAILIIPFAEFITEWFGAPFESQSILIEFIGIFGLFLAVLYLIQTRQSGSLIKKKSDVFYCTLLFFMLQALIFSEDIVNSLDGYVYDELPFHFVAYYSLFFAGTVISDSQKKIGLMKCYLIVATLQGTIGVFQSYGLRICDCFFDAGAHARENMVYGLTQHQNFYAGLSILLVGCSMGVFIFSEQMKKKYWSLLIGILLCVSFYTSICTTARIAWVGNATLVLFYFISFYIVKTKNAGFDMLKRYKTRFLFAFVMMLLVFLWICFTKSFIFREFFQTSGELSSGYDRWGSGRLYIWRMGLYMVPSHFFTGVGLDNYRWCFYNNPEWIANPGWTQAKGHNEYIHIMVTQGVPSLVNYICLLYFASSTAIKKVLDKTSDTKNRTIIWGLMAMFTGYVAQALVNSSVINIAMYFWIIIGLLLPRSEQRDIEWKKCFTKLIYKKDGKKDYEKNS